MTESARRQAGADGKDQIALLQVFGHLIAAHPDDPLQVHSPEAADLAPDGRWDALPDEISDVAQLYENFLSDP